MQNTVLGPITVDTDIYDSMLHNHYKYTCMELRATTYIFFNLQFFSSTFQTSCFLSGTLSHPTLSWHLAQLWSCLPLLLSGGPTGSLIDKTTPQHCHCLSHLHPHSPPKITWPFDLSICFSILSRT